MSKKKHRQHNNQSIDEPVSSAVAPDEEIEQEEVEPQVQPDSVESIDEPSSQTPAQDEPIAVEDDDAPAIEDAASLQEVILPTEALCDETEVLPTEDIDVDVEPIQEASAEAEPVVDEPVQEQAEDEAPTSEAAQEDEPQQEDEALQSEPEVKQKKPKKQLTPEQKEARKKWWKKNYWWVTVCAVLVLLLLGATVGFLVVTRGMAFVKSADAIDNAIRKGKTELVLTADVVYNNDLALGKGSINLNGHILTVEGDVELDAWPKGSYIGSRATPWSEIGNKGGLVCDTLRLTGSLWRVGGTISASLQYVDEGKLILYGSLSGSAALGDQTELALYGSADTVNDGFVTAYDGAHIAAAYGSNELVIYPTADVVVFNTQNYYYVYRLDSPSVWVEDEDEIYTVVIAGEAFAKSYVIYFADKEPVIVDKEGTSNQVTYVLPSDVTPGNYVLRVVARNTDKGDHLLYLDSAAVKVKVKYYADLAQPTVAVEKTDAGYQLVIGHVDNATQFIYSINGGKTHKVDAQVQGDTIVSLYDDLAEVGTYLLRVTAKHPKSNYKDSKVATYTQKVVRRLQTPAIGAVTLVDGRLSVAAEVDVGANCIALELLDGEGAVLYRTQCAYLSDDAYAADVPLAARSAVRVRLKACGLHYYLDSDWTEADVQGATGGQQND